MVVRRRRGEKMKREEEPVKWEQKRLRGRG